MALGVANREFVESDTEAEFIRKKLNFNRDFSKNRVGAQDNQICTGSSNPDHPITRSPDHPITRSPDHPITRILEGTTAT
jgi:hypothetical protein